MEKVTCPICLIPKEQHSTLAGREYAVSFCPSCGIPHFMEPDSIPERVVCEVCQRRFDPNRGGGATLRYNMEIPPYVTPGGVRFIILRRGDASVNKNLEVFVNKPAEDSEHASTRADDSELMG